ncbi:hypothetical protein [Streptomyces sp. NPDC048825]|uniref:hypothetical protein n=1 Tax=Streptomyces sp. NPDC048825 TaxID=3365592 RepID=UPI003723BD1F
MLTLASMVCRAWRASAGIVAVPVLRGLLAQSTALVEFVPGELAPGGGDIGQDLRVPAQIALRRLRLGHSAPSADVPLTPDGL